MRAIADAPTPRLRPKYRVAIEKRVDQTTGEDSLLVGILDFVVSRSASVLLVTQTQW